jgi:organic radical activating enzyme
LDNKQDIPNPCNFCGGNFQGWLEVNLIKACNAKCAWCVEKAGWHPEEKASWQAIADAALATGRKNIILLGGEPTLYKDLQWLINRIKHQCDVWITTNGSLLSKRFINKNMRGIDGVNISIHHYDMWKNQEITGIWLDIECLRAAIKRLHELGATVRINCNCISKYIDSRKKIKRFIAFAKSIGADGVRFAELKLDNGNFVDLAKVFRYDYGLNDDPFKQGCWKATKINDMPVNFRQMCGLQTDMRKKPANPVQCVKQVLYYDGKIYDGWQTMTLDRQIEDKLIQFQKGKITLNEAAMLIGEL